jgi:hypothetical protein
MAEPKTTRTDASVPAFLDRIADPKRRADALELCDLMTEVTGEEPAMWGPSIVGYGSYRYRYGSGREGMWPAVGFSPRKQALTLYLSDGYEEFADLLARLGPHTTSRACLYLKRLSDVDTNVLREMVRDAYRHINGATVESGEPS